MWILVEQYCSRVGFHNHFVNASKECLIAFLGSILEYDARGANCVQQGHIHLWKICYNSQSQDVNRPFSTGRFVAPFQTMWWYSREFFHSKFQIVACMWIKIIIFTCRDWIKEQFSWEYHVVCNGKANCPSEKGLFSCQNWNKLHNKKCGMKWCFSWHIWCGTMCIFHYLWGKWMTRRKI